MTWFPGVITDAALPLRGERQGRDVLDGQPPALPVQDRDERAALIEAVIRKSKTAQK